eukprot:scaffold38047_cov32-Tisochrysis_lutea.AAC.3
MDQVPFIYGIGAQRERQPTLEPRQSGPTSARSKLYNTVSPPWTNRVPSSASSTRVLSNVVGEDDGSLTAKKKVPWRIAASIGAIPAWRREKIASSGRRATVRASRSTLCSRSTHCFRSIDWASRSAASRAPSLASRRAVAAAFSLSPPAG